MEDFQSETFNSFNRGIGKDIKDSTNCTNGKNFSLYVVGVPPDFTQKGLHNLFGQCGEILKLNILPPKQIGWPKVSFVEFGKMTEVLKALEMYKEFPIGNYTIKTSIAKKKDERPAKLTNDSLKDVDLGECVEKSIQLSRDRAEKRFEKMREQKKQQRKEEEKSKQPCAVCSKLCLSTCGQCKTVFYCGSTCQRDDWIGHKKVCKLADHQQHMKDISGNEMSDSSDNLMVEVDNVFVDSVKSHVQSIAKPIKPDVNKTDDQFSQKSPTPAVNAVLPDSVSVGKMVKAFMVDLQVETRILYFQLAPNAESVLATLDHAINDYYGQGKGVESTSVQIGGMYACKFSIDQRWYRVYVQDMNEEKGTCNVWYIDFANCENVQISNLMILQNEFLDAPPFSLRCKLYGCDRIKVDDIVQTMGEYLNQLPIELEIKSIVNSIAFVALFFDVEGTKTSLNKTLIEKFLPNIKQNTCPKKDNVVKISTPAENVCSPKPTQLNTGLRVVRKIPVKSDLSSIFQKIKFKQPKSEEIFEAVILDPIIPIGKFDAVISNVNGVHDISCCVIGPQQEAFIKLQKDLSEYCEEHFLPESFTEGTICAAKCSGKPGWYRAEMLSKVSETAISLLFFDFGNKENVNVERISKFPKEKKFWDLEKQAIFCKLKDCSSGSDDFNTECFGLLKICENQIVTIEVDGDDKKFPLPVTIYINDDSTVNEYITQLKIQFESSQTTHEENLTEIEIAHKEDLKKYETIQVLENVLDDINEGSHHEIALTHAESPEHLVCQFFGENQIKIQEFTTKMAEFYDSSNFGDFELVPNEIYAVRYNIDSMWYRAKILEMAAETASNQDFLVFFVDYGNKEKVKREDIRTLSPEFKILPIQGIKFKLLGVSSGDRSWSDECISILQSLCNQKFDAVFHKIAKDGEVIVEILVDGDSLFEQLVSAGLIFSEKPQLTELPVQEKMEETSIALSLEKNTNVTEENTNSLATLPTDDCNIVTSPEPARKELDNGPPALDNPIITKENKVEGKNTSQIIDQANIPSDLKKVKMPEFSETSDKSHSPDEAQETMIKFKIPCVIPPSDKVSPIGVVYANDPHSFFCQLLGDESAEIAKSLTEINLICAENLHPKASFYVGEFCVACASDKVWYRSKILQLSEATEECLVQYIDYGNEELVNFKKIQEMPSEVAEIESQAIHCKLYDCIPMEGLQWSTDSIDTIKTLINQMCQARFIQQEGDKFAVELLLGENLALNDFLVQQGMAKHEQKDDIKQEEKECVVSETKAESPKPPLLVNESISQDISDGVECTLEEGDMVSIQIYKATSPDELYVKVKSDMDKVFSVKCKLADIKPVGESWSNESSDILTMFPSHFIDGKIFKIEDKNEKGKIYIAKIPDAVNALILAGLAVYCM
uniref:tudor domain-containing protein 1-like n=1 Tax=Styela clava TaxID=7725 RepID=UPI001939621D|nr:tudor domain-containing protein 1-like [Styela clava]